MKPPVNFTSEELAYVRDHHQNTTVPTMAKHLKRANKTVYELMAYKNWTPFKGTARGKAIRYRNQQLEQKLKHLRILNSKNGLR